MSYKNVVLSTVLVLVMALSIPGVLFAHSSGGGTVPNPYDIPGLWDYYKYAAQDGRDEHQTRTDSWNWQFYGVTQGRVYGSHVYANTMTWTTNKVYKLVTRLRIIRNGIAVVDKAPPPVYNGYTTCINPQGTPNYYGSSYRALGSHVWVIANGGREIRVPDTEVTRFPVGTLTSYNISYGNCFN